MKTFLAVVVLVAAGLVIYNYLTIGESWLPPGAPSEDEAAVARLQERLEQVREQFHRAVRMGEESAAELEERAKAARREVEEIGRELEERLAGIEKHARRGSAEVRQRVRSGAARLKAAIDAFENELK